MNDIFASDSRTNATEYTVTEISGTLKRTVEDRLRRSDPEDRDAGR